MQELDTASSVQQNPNGKLILYMIGHGPDAKYLDRLLGQVKPIIDAIAFVTTDDTDDCDRVIDKHGIRAYRDRITFKDRSQFDFSVCRNRALEIAEAAVTDDETWLMWLDCDDSISQPEAILSSFRTRTADAYSFPYNVNPTNGNIRKIRIHRPNQWRWVNKVHEEVRFISEETPVVAYDGSVEIEHLPDQDKSNHDFHIDLLMEGCRNAPNEYAYIAKEFFNRGEYDKALPWLLKTVEIHTYKNEIYQAWLCAGYIALNHLQDNEKAETWLMNAVRAQPHRREAWFFLAQMCARIGGDRLRDALSYVSCANAQIDEKQAMQHERIYYRDAYMLHADLLIAAKLTTQALQVLRKVPDAYRDESWKELRGKCV